MKKILVAGASGYVGGLLVPLLLDNGYEVRCLARTPEKILARQWSDVDVVKGDVLDPDSLKTAMKDIDAAYYLVHAMGSEGDFEERDLKSAANFANAAEEEGVERIIYLGGLGNADDDLSPHLQSRQQAGLALAQTTVPVTELRASIIIGAGSASFEIIRDLVRKLPVMVTPRWVNSRAEPIAVDDVLFYLVACLNEPKTTGKVLEIGGGDVLTYGNMMRELARILGKTLLLIPVPVLTPRLSAYWLNLVTSVPMSLAFPLVEGLKNDTVCQDQRIRTLLPRTLTSYHDAVTRAFELDKRGDMLSRWTEAGSYDDSKQNERREKRDVRVINANRSSEHVFSRIQRIGGKTGWYYANRIWSFRGMIDRIMGGVGMRRGRRHPTNVRIGDAIDFWRVVQYVPGKQLTLRAEMKVPGLAILDFSVKSLSPDQSQLVQTARFYPTGFWGSLYWEMLKPFHYFIFRNMAKRIAGTA